MHAGEEITVYNDTLKLIKVPGTIWRSALRCVAQYIVLRLCSGGLETA